MAWVPVPISQLTHYVHFNNLFTFFFETQSPHLFQNGISYSTLLVRVPPDIQNQEDMILLEGPKDITVGGK